MNKYIGSSFDDFLESEHIQNLAKLKP